MMKTEFVLIFVYLFGRFIFYDINSVINPRLRPRRNILKRSIFGLVSIFLLENLISVLIILLLHELLILLDSLYKPKNPSRSRIWYFSYLLTALILSPLALHFLIPILAGFSNPVEYLFIESLRSTILLNMLISKISLNKILLIFAGYIFTLKEGTILIRLTLNRVRAIPKKKDKPGQRDKEEYDRGKLIGLLERTFLYFLIIFNQIGAIAVIIALKSLARFKELEDKNFAEYFLIGSLLSVLVAVIPAVIIRIILN